VLLLLLLSLLLLHLTLMPMRRLGCCWLLLGCFLAAAWLLHGCCLVIAAWLLMSLEWAQTTRT
jgi:hypothetical protein